MANKQQPRPPSTAWLAEGYEIRISGILTPALAKEMAEKLRKAGADEAGLTVSVVVVVA